ncbi:FxLYD domain-containing protein [Halorussus marinus]|uniref:FxLYD domain-containing protein n=1 Tax=Halorussus marinus TaxID=2505976 RepID=UPI0010932140|nr:FxLYD domain-containing protein [Halorussus marinus]
MRRRALLCAVGASALAGCGGRLGDDGDATEVETETDTQTTASTTTAAPEPALELENDDLVRSNEGSESELARVVGTLHNPTEETVAEATVTATFEDEDGEALDAANASVSELSPGGSWSFELVYPATGEDARAVADYELTVETGE